MSQSPPWQSRQGEKHYKRRNTLRYQSYVPKSERPDLTASSDIEADRALRYVKAETDHEKYAIVCETEASGTDNAIAKAGSMLLDMAMHTVGEQRNAYFNEASERLEKSLVNRSDVFSHPDIARAAVLHAHIDMYAHQLDNPTSMPLALIEKAYERNLEVSAAIVASHHESKAASDGLENDYLGVLGEQSITLLLERFSMNHMDGSWFVQPALYSEDHALTIGGASHAFDIKVLAQDDPSFMFYPAYRIQSKTSPRHDKRYAPHITVVHTLVDLAIDYEGRTGHVGSHIVPAECLFEYEAAPAGQRSVGDIAVAERLDQRTDQLLDILG